MRDALLAYFLEEKRGAVCFALAGAFAMGLSIYFWRGAYRGMLIPLILVGLLELGVGVGIYARTDKQVATLTGELEKSPQALAAVEVPRIERVLHSFAAIKIVELLVFALGVVLTYLFRQRVFVHALGIGCIGQASVMLVLDLFAERRAEHYLAALKTWLS